MITHRACAELVRDVLRPDDLVVCGLGATGTAWQQAKPANLTYYASDPMGMWAAVALGLALARPDRRVVHLAGDGDLVMNLEILITIASTAPANLWVVVFQNDTYASVGGQPLAGAGRVSLATIARGSGLTWAAEAETEAEARTRLGELLSRAGPGLLAIHLENEILPDAPPGPWSQVEERTVFMRRLLGESS